jgi:hypothetical protein
MRRWLSAWILGAVLAGCASHPSEPATPAGPVPTEEPATPAGSCPTEKLAFTRTTACQNDGSVEFCLPRDEQVVRRVRALAPELQGPIGGSGRARCDLTKEELYFFPMPDSCREKGELPEETWARLCQLAADPAVARIVPTWFE